VPTKIELDTYEAPTPRALSLTKLPRSEQAAYTGGLPLGESILAAAQARSEDACVVVLGSNCVTAHYRIRVRRQALASVRGQRGAANVMLGPNDSRVPISIACSNAQERFGKQGCTRASSGTASRRGDIRWITTFKRGFFLLFLLTAGGTQPRL